MKHLIIYSHLNPKSFTKAIADEVETVATSKGHEVQIIDLYGEGFNPVLGMPDIALQFMGKETPSDVKKYQDMVTWADHLTVVYPMWWGQMPAMLKGFIDRVFAHGYAYRVTQTGTEGMLQGKTAHVFINYGTPVDIYEKSNMLDAQKRVIEQAVFEYCGIKTDITFFGQVAGSPEELRKGYLASIKNKF